MWSSLQSLALRGYPVTQRAVQKWLCWKNYSQGHNCNEVLSWTYNIIKISNSTRVSSHPTWLEADLSFGLGKSKQLFTLADHRGARRNWSKGCNGPTIYFVDPEWTDREEKSHGLQNQISSKKEQKVSVPLPMSS